MQTMEKSRCTGSRFSFCFWAKLLVAIPAMPIIAFTAASFFSDPSIKIIMGGVAVFIAIWLAILIDRLPIFSRPIIARKG